ncbi:MAG: D-xylose transport system permease protein [Gaiellaceae bacterium]|jgi:D-xylose transport system permease protein|nr:D-xylose transport system permease protein [Gaiellaceae bacterium]
MSDAAPPEVKFAAEAEEDDSLGAVVRRRIGALKAGDVGSLPVIIGMILITVFFTLKTNVFFTAVNFDNLIPQMAEVTVIAMGVVFVLLIGEIDLSIGYLSGLAAVVVAELQLAGSSHQYPWYVAIAGAIAVGAVIGAVQGSIVAFLGVPSFVVTLAGLLAWNGVIIQMLGTQGVIGIQEQKINDVANYFFPTWFGWAAAAAVTVGYLAIAVGGYVARRRAGLRGGNLVLIALRVVFFSAIAWVVAAICNHSRGVPFAGVLIIVLLVFWTFIAQRTTFGRHVYAVGGNAEAARRAGINVKFIRVAVFTISGAMAAVGGIVAAARLQSVDLTAGSGTILLDAISAAVIGGTSLFGGRGFVKAALLGALITQTIQNGIDLVGYSDAVKDIVTAAILLAAVTLDTVLRRRQAATGR